MLRALISLLMIAGPPMLPAQAVGTPAEASLRPKPAAAHQTLVEKPKPGSNTLLAAPDKVVWPTPDRSQSHRLGVGGPVYRVAAQGRATLSYKEFAHAYGGDWGARLRLVQLPDCALTSPQLARCRTTRPLPTVNDPRAQTLTADVTANAVLAMEAGDASAQGDFKATPLAPASSWNTSLTSGGFSWSYPIKPPATPGGLGPQISLDYSSQAVDGRTSATNNQGSWVGDGFSFEPGYIERSYKSCADDGHTGSAERCWAFHNATIMMSGRSGALIKIDENTWKLSYDDGSRLERLENAANGDNNGEYWKLTTTDGTQYFFGLNQLPGYVAGKEETESVWTSTVYGDDSGEPCNLASGFSTSHCDQAWRWNLDHVIDARGNVLSFFYDKEINYYAREGKTDVNGTPYVRGGYLTRVDYGQREGQVYTTDAPARVAFTVVERCVPDATVDCDPEDLTAATAASWPDVPQDLICAAGTKCKSTQASTTFFTRKRLTKVETQVRHATGWTPVESWALQHGFQSNNDNSRTLWLQKIVHTGHWGETDVTLPVVELEGQLLANRIDRAGDSVGELNRFRIHRIKTEGGLQISVAYKPVDCDAATLPAPDSTNPKRCYPVRWNPTGGPEAAEVVDWFHKYVVDRVTEDDLVGGNPDQVTAYEYHGPAAWVKTKPDGITKDKFLQYADWRGYAKVTARTGDGYLMPTRTEHSFLRGLGGTVTDSTGKSYTDSDALAGHELESIEYSGADPVSKTINEPWRHVTHTQTESWGTREAAILRTGATRHLTAMPGGGWLESTTTTQFDTAWARPTMVEELNPAGNQCTRTWYADNPAKYFYSYAYRTQTVAVKCAETPDLAKHLLKDDRTGYDLQAPGVPPTNGTVTRTETLDKYDGTIQYALMSQTLSVDEYGRALSSKDALGKASTVAYTQTNGLTTKVKTTVALNTTNFVTTLTQDPAFGVTLTSMDPNGKKTERAYDALGRLTAVWRPDRNRSNGAEPSVKHTYRLSNDKTSAVVTETARNDGTYRPSYELYDGHMRSRQTQVLGEGGWLISDTFHDATGKVAKTNSAYLVTGTPGQMPLATAQEPEALQTQSTYDGAGRLVAETTAVKGERKWSTTTAYQGDRVVTTPPTGAAPTTTVTDARGRIVERHQATDVTKYTYTPGGQLDTMIDPLGNVWEYDYNQRGQKVTAKDPDSGTSTYTYDNAGNVTTQTDASGITLTHKYDAFGRKYETWQGATKLASFTYDTVALGQRNGATRYTPTGTYAVTYGSFDALYRPLKTTYWIPGSDVGSTQQYVSYTFTTAYNLDGTVQSLGSPAGGGLPAENLVLGYDTLQRPVTLTGADTYVTGTTYGNVGETRAMTLDAGAQSVQLSWEYEPGTGRLARSTMNREDVAVADVDAHYDYDPAGNIRSIADIPVGGHRDVQCFEYDQLWRLDNAWSTAQTCADGPTAAGGPAPYWHSWEIDKVGNRQKETVHGLGGAADVVRTYVNPAQGQGQNKPHTVSQVEQTGGSSFGYEYDAVGNTSKRPGETLTWDAEGRMATSKPDGGQVTSYVYDAAGERLVRKEPGANTIYLAGQELRFDTATRTMTGTRHYGLAGKTVAVRGGGSASGGKVTFLAQDHHDTAAVSVDATSGRLQTRRSTPYGGERGAPPTSWPDDKGFISGTKDPTGLVHVGAREYDAGLGRFTSTDPLVVTSEPQQLHAYSYANANPVTRSDPSGACIPELCDPEYHQQDASSDCEALGEATCAEQDQQNWEAECGWRAHGCAPPVECTQLKLPDGSCVQKRYAIPGNLKNGSTQHALQVAADHKLECKAILQTQIYCFNARNVDVVAGALPFGIEFPVNSPMTIGDVVFYPEAEQDLWNRLFAEDDYNDALQTRGFTSDVYRNLVAHEKIHAYQWSAMPDVYAGTAMFGISAGSSELWSEDHAKENPLEQEANLYWGGYQMIDEPLWQKCLNAVEFNRPSCT